MGKEKRDTIRFCTNNQSDLEMDCFSCLISNARNEIEVLCYFYTEYQEGYKCVVKNKIHCKSERLFLVLRFTKCCNPSGLCACK